MRNSPQDPRADEGRDPSSAAEQQEAQQRLLEIIGGLSAELHPQQRCQVSLQSRLDAELGFDSLSRIELLMRIGQAFGVSLPDELVVRAETPADLWQALQQAPEALPANERPAPLPPGDSATDDKTPDRARTLLEVLQWHLAAHPERVHVHLYGSDDRPEEITYRALHEGAGRVAAALGTQGLGAGQTVALMLPTGRDYLFAFLGVLMAGGVPVPIYPPARPSQIEDHLRRHVGILDNAQACLLLTVDEARLPARLLLAQVPSLRRVLTPAELTVAGPSDLMPRLRPDDIAFLQYTSGSTGSPKGVVLSHANLLANIRAMGGAIGASSRDVFVSWLPLYHDMGLIGAWLGSLYYACPLVLMSPLAFLARPQRWLWAIHRHGGTLSAAPNFAYELCLGKIRDEDIAGLDLSRWRLAFNGAEPVSAKTVRRFGQRFAAYGFRHKAMAPVYGLAECAVGLAFPPVGREVPIDRVQREPMMASGEAVPADASDTQALSFVGCGRGLPGYHLRVVDEQGNMLPDRRQGRLQFRGPSATRGYYRNPEQTRKLFDGQWLNTGDLAYLDRGELYVTSRWKDLIIRAGRNIHPYELEEAVGEIPGVRKGCVAVFGSVDPDSGTERLVVLAETRQTDPAELARMTAAINEQAVALTQTSADDVLLVPPHTVLKTSSGKIRRAACRELYESGRIRRAGRTAAWQWLRLALSAGLPQLKRAWRRLLEGLYGAYAGCLFWVLAPTFWLLVVSSPRPAWCWWLSRAGARLLARLTATPMRVEGLQNLPADRPCVLVSNHTSYLDGIVLVATLPPGFSFVAKAELQQSWYARWFLRRLGTVFVERFDLQESAEDAGRLVRLAKGGRTLSFFPEGTFRRATGLLPFHMGAFVAAASAGLPVVPVTLRGPRRILPAEAALPRHGRIEVVVGKSIEPKGDGWSAAIKLRDEARAEILRQCGEPDLS